MTKFQLQPWDVRGLTLRRAAADGRHRWAHAYPRVDNAASNAVCRKAGFELLGEVGFEYPEGTPIRCCDWRFDLTRPELL